MKQKPAFLAKVTRPGLTGVFPRNRLFDLLDDLRKRPVIWVSGPPGCGKTTLISSYIEARAIPCLWYHIDEGDADVATFFYFMDVMANTAALQRRTSHLPVPEHLQNTSGFALRYFEDFYDRLKIPGLLVFDNYEKVQAVSQFHEVIRLGLSRIPEGLNVVLISHTNPLPVFVRILANHQMALLGWNLLRLTSEESDGIVRYQLHERQAKETTLHLHTATDGWAAGLVLMLEKAKRKCIDLQSVPKHTREEVFAYFVAEIFNKTDSKTRDFLLKSAFLPKMTEKMAEELTGHPQTRHILSELNRNNCFTEKLYVPVPVYRYHPLFRDFLLCRAKGTFSAQNLAILHRHAVKLLEESDQTEAAVALLDDAGDWAAKVRLITIHAPSMLAQGRHRLLETWLNNLPNEIIENTPWISYWVGSCRLPFDPCLSKRYFGQAFERFKICEDVAGMLLAWSGIIESIAYGQKDFSLFDQWISIIEEIMPGLNGFPSKEIEARVAASMFTALALRQPQHSKIETWAERALMLAKDNTDIDARRQTLSHLALYRIVMGDFEKAARPADALADLSGCKKATPLEGIQSGYADALYCLLAGSHEKCLEVVSDALELSRTSGVHIMDSMLLGQAVSSALNASDCKTAEELLKKNSPSLNSFKPLAICHYHFLKTRVVFISGDLKRALFHVEVALNSAIDVGSPFPLCSCHLLKAQVMHELGDEREAAHHLAHAFSIARKTKSNLLKFYIYWTQAWFALDQGEQASGLKSLKKALAIGRKRGYSNTFIDQPSVTARLCATALHAQMGVEYVQELIRRHNLIPDNPPLHLENWPWALKIFTLGRFALVRDGRPIRFSRKVQEKPLAMLKALIALGGRDVRQDRIADALWPEADGDMMHKCFGTTLHRLRKLIGIHEAIELRDGRLTLDQRYCWVDVWAFERIFGEADAAWKKGETTNDMTQAIQLTQKAIDIYKGAFLARETWKPWKIALCDRLRSKFLRGVGRLGKYWERAGETEKAIECYQRGLEVDDVAEEFCKHLLVCYHGLGRRAEALSVFNRLKKALSATLGINPSPETEAMCRHLCYQ